MDRLKQFDTFFDTSIEVDIAACFVEAGYKVELYPILAGGKKCDMKVRGANDWIYIEITHLRLSKNEKKGFKLSGKFIDRIHRVIPEKISGMIRFTGPQLQPNKTVENIIQRIKKEYAKNGLPIEFKDAEVDVNLGKGERGKALKVEGLSFLALFHPKTEGRHLIERALGEYDQLPEDGPGVIIVNPVWLLAPEVGEGMEERLKGLLNPNVHTRVSGIVISNKAAERSGILKTVPIAAINPFAKQRCDNDIKKLAEALSKYPEWM